MKTYFKLSIAVLALILFTGQSQAQKIKFGHSNTTEIFELMPEAKEAEKALQEEQQKIQSRIMTMQTEYQELIQEYTENEQLVPQSPEKWSAADKADKEAAIRSLEQRITTYQSNAQSSLQEKQSELYKPILEKIENAIEKIRKENGYTIIFDDNVLLSFDKETVTDVNPMIKKELGLQ
jgi:outer membrane protein